MAVPVLAVSLAACDRTQPASHTAEPPISGGATGKAALETWRDATLPEGTTLSAVLDTPISSDRSRVEDVITAHLTRPVVIDNVEVLPEGSTVHGLVTEATRAGKVKGRAQLAFRFYQIAPRGSDALYDLSTATVHRIAPSEKRKDAMKIGVPAAGGAIVGGIVGGKKGAMIGGAVGAGAGTAVVMTDRGQDVRLAKGATLALRLDEPLVVRIKADEAGRGSGRSMD
jgi:hypothetical protein